MQTSCFTSVLKWSDQEIAEAGPSIASLLMERAMALRETEMFHRYHQMSDTQLIIRAWQDAAKAMNRIIDVYGNGIKPFYPAIDSASFNTQSEQYARLLHILVSGMEDESSSDDLFFHYPLRFSLRLLDANRRDESGRFEPLHHGENKAAYHAISTTDWKRYPYSVILVPGSGSESVSVSMSPWGKERARLALKRYHEGKAPFIIVSGGYVHPSQTPHCEAMEMKKALMAAGVPESAILIDPHARHTTTNLRNASRLIFRYGIPTEKKALVTTDLYQSKYIESPVFARRCQDELGYQPMSGIQRISPQDIEFLPGIESLHADALESLDP